jgi:hypothetical protein
VEPTVESTKNVPATPATPEAQVEEPRPQRTSRGMKPVLKIERGIAKAASRVSNAVARGCATYLEHRDLSAERRRNGALRDAPSNVARGVGKAMKIASRAPFDVMRTLETRRIVKPVTKAVRNFMRALPR